MTSSKAFPELAIVLQREIERARHIVYGGTAPNLRQLASDLKVPLSGLHAWIKGTRSVSDHNAWKLANYFRERGIERDALHRELIEACAIRETVEWHDRLESGDLALRIQHTSYPGAVGFLDIVFERFRRMAGLSEKPVSVRSDFAELKEDVWRGHTDIALGLLATPDRCVKLKFFHTPIRYGINCVYLKNGLRGAKLAEAEVRAFLLGAPSASHLAHILNPVVMESEVGGLYMSRILDFRRDLTTFVPRLSPQLYVQKMLEEDCSARLSVAVADEVTCFEIVSHLHREGQRPCLLFMPATERSSREPDQRLYLPEFLLGMAVKRTQNLELIDVLRDSFGLFLRTEAEWVAMQYVELAMKLYQVARESLPDQPETCREWVEYAFRLNNDMDDPFYDRTLPWSHIISRARARYSQALRDYGGKAFAAAAGR